MSKRLLTIVGVLIFLAIGSLLLLYAFAPENPKFVIKNLDSEPVHVIAHWRDKAKDIGDIASGKSVEFSVNDEAAMSFEITRKNGTGINTSGVYFTAGVTTYVNITHTSVEVKSNVGT